MIQLPIALGREDVGDYVLTLVYVYVALIFIRILLSWIPRIPYNRFLSAFITFIHDVTDPYLNLFRRVIPMARVGPAAIDLSPMVATLVLLIAGPIIAGLIHG